MLSSNIAVQCVATKSAEEQKDRENMPHDVKGGHLEYGKAKENTRIRIESKFNVVNGGCDVPSLVVVHPHPCS